MEIIEGIIVFSWFIYMSGFFGYNTLLMFNYKFNKNPLEDITFFEGLKNLILCIIVGALYFIIGVSLCYILNLYYN